MASQRRPIIAASFVNDLQRHRTTETLEAMKNGNLASSFRRALVGVRHALRSQRNVRIHAAAAAIILALGLALRISSIELALLVLAIGAVVAAELLNTAIENAVDLAAPYVDPLAGTTKDIAAGAVLVVATVSVVVGILVLGPHLIALLPSIG